MLPAGLLQPLPIPTRRWEQISMDFIFQLPKTKRGFDAILVIVDRLTKRAHFIPTTTNASAVEVAEIFMQNIFKLHGLPAHIISDRDPQFTSRFWKALFEKLGTRLAMSTAFHPQTDGQTERTNRTLEEMLRCYVNYKQDNWDTQLHIAKFAYNNASSASTGISPFLFDTGQPPMTPVNLCNPRNEFSDREEQKPPPIIVNDEEEYEVECILDHRYVRGKKQYLVKWTGYPRHDATWEPEKHLTNASGAIQDYEDRHIEDAAP
ncbi:uncharacterized protein VTP21DRAFT_11363 [Calcarisporiella thermophila]|uniref:uncharacterized protein n=1 Tax=Calcarisporiella thermophila TaxID=911321 RepID=UPI0037439278